MEKHFPPLFQKQNFTCPHCDVYATQKWYFCLARNSGNAVISLEDVHVSICDHCHNMSIWHEEKLLIPASAPVPPAHADLPVGCKSSYDEARNIVGASPSAAAALLRLTLQRLMVHLGEKGKNLNDDIGSLVAKGLPLQIQQALDYCRVVGNNAVHPLEIQINDTPEIAHTIFGMLNLIVEDRIAKPKQVAAAYALLPEAARKAIEARDAAAAPARGGLASWHVSHHDKWRDGDA